MAVMIWWMLIEPRVRESLRGCLASQIITMPGCMRACLGGRAVLFRRARYQARDEDDLDVSNHRCGRSSSFRKGGVPVRVGRTRSCQGWQQHVTSQKAPWLAYYLYLHAQSMTQYRTLLISAA
jgi:hypothetical protein